MFYRSASFDVEPVYTFRAHNGPVLCLAMNGSGEAFYSAGADATIRCWSMPSCNTDPYDAFGWCQVSLSPAIYFYFIDTFFTRLFTSVDSNVLQDTLVAHTDAIWDLAINSTRCQLLSASSDGTVRLWEPGTSSGLLATYQVEDGLCIHCSGGSCVLTVI